MAKTPVSDLADSANAHFEAAVKRPVRASVDFANTVGGKVREWVDEGTAAANRLMGSEPKKRTKDIVLKPDPTHGGKSKVVGGKKK